MANKQLTYGVEPIFTDKKPDSTENVIEIIEESMPIFLKNQKYIIDNIDFNNGVQSKFIPDTGRKFNEKIISNKIKPIIESVVSLTLSDPFYYTLLGNDENKKQDLEVISNYFKIANEHQKDCDTFHRSLVGGTAYRLTASIYSNTKPKGHLPFDLYDLKSEECFVVRSTEVGHPIVLSAIVSTINGISRISCFSNTDKWIFESGHDSSNKYVLISTSKHYLGTNPIQEYPNGIWASSLVADLRGNQELINILKSSMANDTMLFVNKLLVIIGVELSKEQISTLKDENILLLPSGQETNSKIDAKYIEAQLNNEGNKSQIAMAQEDMLFIASVPTQNIGRAETGEAVKNANGSSLADVNGDRRIRRFIEPKRQQLECVLSILKTNGYLKSDIQSSDIDIKFDNNRLINSVEMIKVIIELITNGADIYEVCKMFNIAPDNKKFADLWQEGIDKIKAHEIEMKESGRTMRTAPLVEKTTTIKGDE